MPWLTTVTIVGVVVLAALIWLFVRLRSKDLIEDMLKRRATSKVASRAELLEGANHIVVALSLSDDKLSYANPDLDAFIELQNVDEVEYDDETATGHSVQGRVLRLRSHGHAFEFQIDPAAARQWEAALPARQVDAGHRQAV